MTTPTAGRTHELPPVRPATALAVITAVLALGQVVALLGRLVPWARLGLGGDVDLDPGIGNARVLVVVLAVAALVLVMAGLALGIASTVLSILVVVRGRGLLRRGAVILLIPIVMSMLFSVDVSGDLDALPARVGTALFVLGLLGDLLVLALTVTGLWFLVAGLRQLRRGTPDAGV